MDQPLSAAIRRIEVQKGEAFMDAFKTLRAYVEKTLKLENDATLMARRVLSALLLFRMGEIPSVYKKRVLSALKRQGKFKGIDLGAATKEEVQALEDLIRNNLWMLEVSIA